MPDTFDPYASWLGIEPHERPLDHYRLLGLERFEQRREVIQAAADQRMAYIRSFQAGPRVAHTQKLLNELATAKLCLLDERARSAYDANLRAQMLPPAQGPLFAEAAKMAAYSAPPMAPPSYMAPNYAMPSVEPPPPPAFQTAATPGQDLGSRGLAAATSTDESPAEDSPFYTKIWFPAALGAGLVAILVCAWGINKFLATDPVTVVEQPEEVPFEPEQPTVEEPAPAPAPLSIIEPDDSGALVFLPTTALLTGNLRLDSQGGAEVAENWVSADDSMSWEFTLKKPGIFRVEIEYAAKPESAGGRYEIAVSGESRSGEIRSGSKADEFVTDRLFFAIRRGGRHTLSLRADDLRGKELLVFKELRLAPRK